MAGFEKWSELLDARPTCRRCEELVNAIHPLRDKEGSRSAWCSKCIVRHRLEITKWPDDFETKQGEMF